MADTKIKENTQITSTNVYDETPYESYPYAQTRPENLKAIAHVFGLETPALETAKFLELGCASGGNIITHATHYPKAKFVGVDLSKVQVDMGMKQIKELGLKNIELKAMSITDINKAFGEFDYIICHGVLSWVPENVRDAILRVSNENLSKNGLSYISYNTLPGWNMVKTIRDMMMFHSRNFKDINEQVQQSRLLLNFVKDSLEGSNNPYGQILEAEAKLLATQPDHYLRHDHMEEINHQYYFHEFMKDATKHGLQYLGDASLASMYNGNLPQKVAEKLQEVTDIIRSEQYMDFVTNRRFRSTILCKNNVKLNRNITGNSLDNLYFSMKITPEKARKDVTIDSNESIEFYYNNSKDHKLNTTSPVLKAMLYILNEQVNYALEAKELAQKIQELLPKNKYTNEQVMVEIVSNITRLVFSGFMTISSEQPKFAQTPSDKPKISDLVRVQIEAKQNWATNEAHDKVMLSPLDIYTLKYLDGKHDKEQVLDKLVGHVSSGDLKINQNDKPVTDLKIAKELLKPYMDQCLVAYAQNALLVS